MNNKDKAKFLQAAMEGVFSNSHIQQEECECCGTYRYISRSYNFGAKRQETPEEAHAAAADEILDELRQAGFEVQVKRSKK